jgi:hypothetical protein
MDVLSASGGDDKIAWYENDGNENFSTHTITTNTYGACSVYAVDVDGDGDIDVLSACWEEDKIAWYENNGNENFSAFTITNSADGACSVFAIDVDGDGDIDVLSASEGDDKITWYENDGNENFYAFTITDSADGARSVYAVDMDGDGDVDVLSASGDDGKIAWYENVMITNIGHQYSQNQPDKFRLYDNYPNPFNLSTSIEFDLLKTSEVTLKILNILGEEVKTLVSDRLTAGNYTYHWDAGSLASGVYLYRLQAGDYIETRKIVLMK